MLGFSVYRKTTTTGGLLMFIFILKSLLHGCDVADVSWCNHTTYQYEAVVFDANISVHIVSVYESIHCLRWDVWIPPCSPLSLHCIILEFCCALETPSLYISTCYCFFLPDQIWPTGNGILWNIFDRKKKMVLMSVILTVHYEVYLFCQCYYKELSLFILYVAIVSKV